MLEIGIGATIQSFCFQMAGFLLVRFISDNMLEAKQLMSTVESRSIEENSLVIRCINDLGLIQLDRDDSLSSEAMVQCCKRLLTAAPLVSLF